MLAVFLIFLWETVSAVKNSRALFQSAAQELFGRKNRLTPSEVTQTFQGTKLITSFEEFTEYTKGYLDDDALQYVKEVLNHDADDIAKLKKIAQLVEDGSKKIGKKLSKEELKAGLDAFWDDAGVESALAAIEKCWKQGGKFVSEADRLKIDAWRYTPDDSLYLKYKDVFDNPKYYNQKTGEIHWPKNDGFLTGTRIDNVMIQKGTVFKRYGSASGEFLGNATDPYELRALAPHSEGAEIHYYELIRDCEMTTGKIAPWFGSEGGGEQFLKYQSDGKKFSVQRLIDDGFLRDITNLVERGVIKID